MAIIVLFAAGCSLRIIPPKYPQAGQRCREADRMVQVGVSADSPKPCMLDVLGEHGVPMLFYP